MRSWSWGVTAGAVLLLACHLFVPTVRIDAVAVALFVLAALPWVWPWLKSIEFPGGKIELRETKAATDRVIASTEQEERQPRTESDPTATRRAGETMTTLEAVADQDPNLALVGFRIAIEQRLRRLAANNDIPSQGRSLSQLMRDLSDRNLISLGMGTGLNDLIVLGNQAAHGHEVSSEAGNWVLATGGSVLRALDRAIEAPNDSSRT